VSDACVRGCPFSTAARSKPPFEDREGGWTFVETLIVVAIILILSSSVGFIAYRYIDRAKAVSARAQVEAYALALDSYFIDCARYPSQDQGLGSLWEKPSIEPVPSLWRGPYVNKSIQKDPWGNAYEYLSPGKGGLPFGIRSLGADGKEGGDGNEADISSWQD
jgi:general secretion pathway protein G